MMAEIDVVTRSLKTRGHDLSSCRAALDFLIESVQEAKHNRDAAFLFHLGTQYIGMDYSIEPGPIFASAVTKIQREEVPGLTNEDKISVIELEIHNNKNWMDSESLDD